MFSAFSTGLIEGDKRDFFIRRGLTRRTRHSEKKSPTGSTASQFIPFRGKGKTAENGKQGRLAKPETMAANPDELGLVKLPTKLWITLFMKLGDQAESRANTGLQGLFKNTCNKLFL
jgi:hypothetical protein